MATGKQGFASMDPAKRSAIASLGGKAAHAKGVAHRWTSKEASAAGRKGGAISAAKYRDAEEDDHLRRSIG